MKCCNQNHKTPFCPLCGKQLRQGYPLDGLLQHVRSSIKGQSSAIESAKERGYRSEEYIEHRIKVLAKWEAWEQALVALIEHNPQSK